MFDPALLLTLAFWLLVSDFVLKMGGTKNRVVYLEIGFLDGVLVVSFG